MAATAAQIATYLANIKEAQVLYADSVIVKERLGYPNIIANRVVLTVLNAYVDIVSEYFSEPVYSATYFLTTNNFYDVEEVEDVMLRINKICDTNYYLNL